MAVYEVSAFKERLRSGDSAHTYLLILFKLFKPLAEQFEANYWVSSIVQ